MMTIAIIIFCIIMSIVTFLFAMLFFKVEHKGETTIISPRPFKEVIQNFKRKAEK